VIAWLLVGMSVLATASMVLNALIVSTTQRLIRSHARERDLLVNQILHLSGRTWTPPPADQWTAPKDREPLVREWTATPEQTPYQ
jgi:hypothetical protein